MELTEAMRTAATIRRFRADPVSDDVLYRVIDSAGFAPSGGNRQGWHVIVVRDQEHGRGLKSFTSGLGPTSPCFGEGLGSIRLQVLPTPTR